MITPVFLTDAIYSCNTDGPRHPSQVVLVSTPGAWRWQRTIRGEEPLPSLEGPASPLDTLLFPSLLQQLLQSPYLMADYSKVFVVR